MVEEHKSQTESRPTHAKGGTGGSILFISLALILAVAGGGYLLVVQSRQTDDNSESSGSNGGSEKEKEAENEIDQQGRFKQQHQQLLRADLRKLVEEANLIRQDIDSLEKNIDAYEQRFEDLSEPGVAKRLIENEWAVRYIADRHGEVLPPRAVVRNLRTKFDELTLSAERTLLKPNEAYAISKETRQAIHSIRFEVNVATEQYGRHLRLLDGLMESASEEQNGKPEVDEGAAPSDSRRVPNCLAPGTESDTESLVFGGKSCRMWKLQSTERRCPLSRTPSMRTT